MDVLMTRRMIILTEGNSNPHTAKTACCLIRYKREEVVAVLDSTQSGTTEQALGVGADVPFVSSLEQAADANTLLIAANGPTSQTFTYTGTEDSHSVNGSLWYYQAGHSWGYAPAGSQVSERAPCETEEPGAENRLCLTMESQNGQYVFVPGGRCGSHDFTQGGGGAYEWLVYYR